MGVRLHRIHRPELLALLELALGQSVTRYFASVNAHAMNLAWTLPDFRAALNRADVSFVDGFGVILAARLTGVAVGERLTFADWMPAFFEICAKQQAPVFWLGDTEEVGAAFGRWLAQAHPHTPFAGLHHGFFDKHGPENETVLRRIADSGAQVLLVGMSMPIQERWIVANWAHLQRLRVIIPSGGYARIATGIIPRGPRWMTDHGLEWLYRFCQQPAYTWKRYWLGNPLFLARALLWRYAGLQPC